MNMRNKARCRVIILITLYCIVYVLVLQTILQIFRNRFFIVGNSAKTDKDVEEPHETSADYQLKYFDRETNEKNYSSLVVGAPACVSRDNS